MAPDKPPIRLTRRTRRILLVLLSGAPNLTALVICAAAGLRSGTIHPVLAKLEAAGWADSQWEWGTAAADAGPRHRFYHLTPKGRYQALALLHLEEGRGCDRG